LLRNTAGVAVFQPADSWLAPISVKKIQQWRTSELPAFADFCFI
jgi:hypothetical protein